MKDDLHHEDGTHRSTARSSSGKAVSDHERKIQAHRADGHSHTKTLTQDEAYEIAKEMDAVDAINRWLERGDGMAVYENADLGHPMVGDRKIVSFGSEIALFENVDVPPDRMPDFPTAINYRYWLKGYYRGEPFKVNA